MAVDVFAPLLAPLYEDPTRSHVTAKTEDEERSAAAVAIKEVKRQQSQSRRRRAKSSQLTKQILESLVRNLVRVEHLRPIQRTWRAVFYANICWMVRGQW